MLQPTQAASAIEATNEPAIEPTTIEPVNSTNSSAEDQQAMLCTVCQWVYEPKLGEPNQGVEPGTAWGQVPEDFLCPECGIGKEVFEPCASTLGNNIDKDNQSQVA